MAESGAWQLRGRERTGAILSPSVKSLALSCPISKRKRLEKVSAASEYAVILLLLKIRKFEIQNVRDENGITVWVGGRSRTRVPSCVTAEIFPLPENGPSAQTSASFLSGAAKQIEKL